MARILCRWFGHVWTAPSSSATLEELMSGRHDLLVAVCARCGLEERT